MGPGNKWGPRNELGAPRAEKFPHLGNYTLTPDYNTLNDIKGRWYQCPCHLPHLP